jgi:hypothetical protein
MSAYIDQKYINLVSSSLSKFKWKKINLANCRCPICGDSENNKNKARGYFFQSDNSYFFKCHNCGASHNVYKFLEIVSPVLFKEYCLEKFLDGGKRIEEVKPDFNVDTTIFSALKYESLDDLPSDHKVFKFLEYRKIPKEKWKCFGYTKHFAEFAKNVNEKYNILDDERILIFMYDVHGKIIGVQGRAFGNSQPKYITLRRDESVKLIHGLGDIDRSKTIFVVEGPIDSLFLPNAIACLGIGNFLEIRNRFPTENLVYIVDNEPRSTAVTAVLKELIDSGEKVCIFPSHIKDKDINDMVLNGVDVCDTISQHTYTGASAMLVYNTWRKCK